MKPEKFERLPEKLQKPKKVIHKPKQAMVVTNLEKKYVWYKLYENREELLCLAAEYHTVGLKPDAFSRLEELEASGFDWTFWDWKAFRAAVIKHGKDNIREISRDVGKR